MVADLNGDGAVDYLYRTPTHLRAYDHYSTGDALWAYEAAPLDTVNGSSFTVADIDGDFQTEVILLDDANIIHVVNGLTGIDEQICALDTIGDGLDDYQRGGYISVANLRGLGDRDIIVQTVDARSEVPEDEDKQYFYINRSLIAINLAEPRGADMQLWRVDQDRNTSDYYEGYWGQAHGAFFCADVDGDGLDEVVGGTFIDHDGTAQILTGYDDSWVIGVSTFVDHIDCISIGDYRQDIAGLEWVIAEEGSRSGHFNTVLLSQSGLIWKKTVDLFTTASEREPQNVCVGEFNDSYTGLEIWNRSRFSDDQHPWVYDNTGTRIADYQTANNTLPIGFNASGNGDGLEMIWTVDWDGSGMEYLAAKARHVHGHVGIFNAVNGSAVWTTMSNSNMQAKNVYVADVAGDSREEIVIFDMYDDKIKIYHNDESLTDTRPSKWDDPLYRRLKQNWSYYSPGSYTAREPVTLAIDVFLEGPYNGSDMSTTLKDNGYIPLTSPYIQDPRVVSSIPSGVVDWVLVELRRTAGGPAVVSRSAFLGSNGRIFTETNSTGVEMFVEKLYDYYIVVRHRNHLAVMSSSLLDMNSGSAAWDFTTGIGQCYGGDAANLGGGVYGMYSGDASGNGQVQNDDKNDYWKTQVGLSGYRSADFNLNGQVQNDDKNDLWKTNVGKGTQVSEY